MEILYPVVIQGRMETFFAIFDLLTGCAFQSFFNMHSRRNSLTVAKRKRLGFFPPFFAIVRRVSEAL